MRISKLKSNTRLSIKIAGEEVEEVKEFCYLGSKITKDGRCRNDIKSRLAQGRKAFEMKRDFLASKISLKIRKRVLKTCIWTKALYGCETWTVEPQERRRIEAFEMWCYRRMLGIKWEEHITNEEVQSRIGEKRSIWNYLTRRRDRLVGHILRHSEVGNMDIILEGTVEGSRGVEDAQDANISNR